MATPFATRGTGDLIIRDGDTVSGDSATGGAGGNVTVEGGDATAASATDGGDVILQPGLEDGVGSIGEVSVTNRTGTEDDAIIAFSSATGNSHTVRFRTGTVQPNSDSVPASAGGDMYVQSDGSLWLATGSGTGNWSEVGSGGATLYSADGSLAGSRIVTMGANDLTFSGTGATNFSSSGISTFAANVILSGTANKFLQDTPAVGEIPTATNVDGSWTWQAATSSQWQEATVQTTDATPTTLATAQTLVGGDQTLVEIEIRAEVSGGGSNTYLHRQVISYYRDGGGAVQWSIEMDGEEQRRGTLTTATGVLTTSVNDILVQVTGQAATTIDWTVQYRTSETVNEGVVSLSTTQPSLLWDTTLYAATFTADSNKKHKYNASTFAGTINMPASPANGDVVILKNATSSVTAVTLSGNGNNVEDPSSYALAASVSLSGDGASFTYSFDGTQWFLI